MLCAEADTQSISYNTHEMAGSDELYVVYGGFQAKNREFIDCLKHGEQPGSNFADTLKTMEGAYRILAQDLLRE